ncbi:MAG: CbtB-domain containing protein, partial [Mycobacterium sp.]
MANPETTGTRIRSVDLSAASAALWLTATVFLALLALYF